MFHAMVVTQLYREKPLGDFSKPGGKRGEGRLFIYLFILICDLKTFKVKNLRINFREVEKERNLYVVVHCMQMTRNCLSS